MKYVILSLLISKVYIYKCIEGGRSGPKTRLPLIILPFIEDDDVDGVGVVSGVAEDRGGVLGGVREIGKVAGKFEEGECFVLIGVALLILLLVLPLALLEDSFPFILFISVVQPDRKVASLPWIGHSGFSHLR